jgi:hypothetical protein
MFEAPRSILGLVFRAGQQAVLLSVLVAGLSSCDTRSPPSPKTSDETASEPISAPVSESPQAAPIQFEDISNETGIAFRHTDGGTGEYFIVETMASGMATFDFDNDGLMDIYFLSGTPLRGAGPGAPQGGNALYRNLGNFRFADVTSAAGVGSAGFGLGVTAGDFNNDGHQDLYVSNFGPKVLYQNRGDGTFVDVAREAGVTDGDQFGAGTAFLDFDNDGHLDLYVANYVDFRYDNHVSLTAQGIPVYASQSHYSPLKHALYRNRGNGGFEDVTQASGLGELRGPGMGVVCADYDNDGDTDIFCANDAMANFCFRNDGTGRFSEVGAIVGLAYNIDGVATSSMGVDCADYDHDGLFDFFVTTYQNELPVLFRNLGAGLFQDVTAASAQTQRCYNNSKWGCGFADFDNDGHKDLFVGVGHLQVNIEQLDPSSSYKAQPMLLRNNGQGRFEDVTQTGGAGLQVQCVARGVALEDLDNDGRIDAVISNSRHPPVVLRNTSQNDNRWLEVRLRGTSANSDAVGARVIVTAGDLVQIDEVRSGRGYQSHFGMRLHFGLGQARRVDKIEVRWPGGKREFWHDLEPNQLVTLTEGMAQAPAE